MHLIDEITGTDFECDVLSADRPVVVEFFSPWCPACRLMHPALEGLADEFEGRARFVKIDVEEEPTVTAAYGVTNTPTLLIFHEGSIVDAHVGIVAPRILEERLEQITF